MKKAVIQLETLSCPSCIRKIETAISNTKGVESVNVLFNSSKVKVEFDDEKVKVEQIVKTITNLGYEVLSSSFE